jgi:hypothetical protein
VASDTLQSFRQVDYNDSNCNNLLVRFFRFKLVQQVTRGAICAGLIFSLTGCVGEGVLRESEVRDIQGKTEVELSIGDPRQKVRSLLGEPLVDGKSLGMEVYRKTGRDIDFIWAIYPIPVPHPGDQVIGYALITYDADNLVTGFAADYWIKLDPGQHGDFWITAGGYHFLNVWRQEPVTIIGTAIPWKKLAQQIPPEGTCTLILVMGECVMEKVSLDHKQIADLAPAGKFCSHYANNNLYGTFLRRNIASGNHRLNVNQAERRSKFETVFECDSGETVYAELDAVDSYENHEGSISISNTPTENIMEMGHLSPILWHRGVWYTESSTAP